MLLFTLLSKRPVWLCVDRVLNCHNVDDTRTGRSWYRRYMQQRVDEIASSKDPYVMNPDWSGIRRGWYFGSDSFRDNLLDRLDGLRAKRKRSSFSSPRDRMHNERESLRLLSAGLKQFGLTSKSLEALSKGVPEKSHFYGMFEAKQLIVMTGYQNTFPVVIPATYHVVLMLLKTKRIKFLTD